MRLRRYIFSPQYRAFLRWQAASGDEILRYDYDLMRDDIVFDVGAFKGEFAKVVAERFGCAVHAFEPVEAFADEAAARTAELTNVHVHRYGLADRAQTAAISVAGLASSRNTRGGTSVIARFSDVTATMRELAPHGVALMKLNIEGDEYQVLRRMIDAGLMSSVRNLQVQFHLLRFGDRWRYWSLRKRLEKTHVLIWRYPFIWESWRLKLPVQR